MSLLILNTDHFAELQPVHHDGPSSHDFCLPETVGALRGSEMLSKAAICMCQFFSAQHLDIKANGTHEQIDIAESLTRHLRRKGSALCHSLHHSIPAPMSVTQTSTKRSTGLT